MHLGSGHSSTIKSSLVCETGMIQSWLVDSLGGLLNRPPFGNRRIAELLLQAAVHPHERKFQIVCASAQQEFRTPAQRIVADYATAFPPPQTSYLCAQRTNYAIRYLQKLAKNEKVYCQSDNNLDWSSIVGQARRG